MKKCPNCGATFPSEMNFCMQCGTKLEEVKAEPSVEEPDLLEVTEEPNDVKKCAEIRETQVNDERPVQVKENKFLEMGLEPTNYLKWKIPSVFNFFHHLFIICFALSFIWMGMTTMNYFFFQSIISNIVQEGDHVLFETECIPVFRGVPTIFNYINRGSDYIVISVYASDDEVSEAKQTVRLNSRISYRLNCMMEVMVFVAITLFFLLLVWLFRRPSQRGKKRLNEVADYIEHYDMSTMDLLLRHQKYVLFVKDGKFGLLNANAYDVILPAQYDGLKWSNKAGFLDAELSGECYMMDYNGNRLK